MKTTFLCSLLITLACPAAFSQGYWDAPVPLSPNAGNAPGPAAVDGHIAVGRHRAGSAGYDSIWVSLSPDTGNHWRDTLLVTWEPGIWGGGMGLVATVYDATGTLWVLYRISADDYGTPSYWFRKSADGGKTFTSVSLGQGQFGGMPPRLAAGSSGDLYALWHPSAFEYRRLCLTRFKGGDERQRTDTPLSIDTSRVSMFDVAVSASGLPVCVWSSLTPGKPGLLYCTTSSDTASLFDKTVRVDMDSVSQMYPSVACDPQGNVYIAYLKDIGSYGYGCFLTRRDTKGESFAPPVLVGDSTSYFCDVCVDSLGSVHVVWENRHRYSTDGGQTFREESVLPGRFGGIAAGAGGEVFATLNSGGVSFDRWHPDSVASVAAGESNVPGGFALEQNWPNPWNPGTTIGYTVGGIGDQGPGTRNVKLSIYNLLGQEVTVLVNEKQAPGRYTVRFDGSRLASGVYLYRLQAGGFVETKRMLLLR